MFFQFVTFTQNLDRPVVSWPVLGEKDWWYELLWECSTDLETFCINSRLESHRTSFPTPCVHKLTLINSNSVIIHIRASGMQAVKGDFTSILYYVSHAWSNYNDLWSLKHNKRCLYTVESGSVGLPASISISSGMSRMSNCSYTIHGWARLLFPSLSLSMCNEIKIISWFNVSCRLHLG